MEIFAERILKIISPNYFIEPKFKTQVIYLIGGNQWRGLELLAFDIFLFSRQRLHKSGEEIHHYMVLAFHLLKFVTADFYIIIKILNLF